MLTPVPMRPRTTESMFSWSSFAHFVRVSYLSPRTVQATASFFVQMECDQIAGMAGILPCHGDIQISPKMFHLLPIPAARDISDAPPIRGHSISIV